MRAVPPLVMLLLTVPIVAAAVPQCTCSAVPCWYDTRCADVATDPYGGLGCNAEGSEMCRSRIMSCADEQNGTYTEAEVSTLPFSCFEDETCAAGGLGCNAGGFPHLRFCGFGAFTSIHCPWAGTDIPSDEGDHADSVWISFGQRLVSVTPATGIMSMSVIYLSSLPSVPRTTVFVAAICICIMLALPFDLGGATLDVVTSAALLVAAHDLRLDHLWQKPDTWSAHPRRALLLAWFLFPAVSSVFRVLCVNDVGLCATLDLLAVVAGLNLGCILHYNLSDESAMKDDRSLILLLVAVSVASASPGSIVAITSTELLAPAAVLCGLLLGVQLLLLPRIHANSRLRKAIREAKHPKMSKQVQELIAARDWHPAASRALKQEADELLKCLQTWGTLERVIERGVQNIVLDELDEALAAAGQHAQLATPGHTRSQDGNMFHTVGECILHGSELRRTVAAYCDLEKAVNHAKAAPIAELKVEERNELEMRLRRARDLKIGFLELCEQADSLLQHHIM